MNKRKSSTSRGNYYKRKTKAFLEADGYTCVPAERSQRIVIPAKEKGQDVRVLFRKTDLLASDIIAMNGEEILFVQSKLGRKNIAEGIKEFHKFPFPRSEQIRCLLFIWEPRVREPEIINAFPQANEY